MFLNEKLKKNFNLIFSVLLIYSCSIKPYSDEVYVGYSHKNIDLFSIAFGDSPFYTIPNNNLILILRKLENNIYYVKFKDKNGYIRNPDFYRFRKYDPAIDNRVYGFKSKKKQKTYDQRPDYYYSIDNSKPVHVNGYYRKNGTYVRPHTRSAPTRN